MPCAISQQGEQCASRIVHGQCGRRRNSIAFSMRFSLPARRRRMLARWVNTINRARPIRNTSNGNCPFDAGNQQPEREGHCCQHGGKANKASRHQHQYPYQHTGQSERRRNAEQRPDCGCRPLATGKSEPDRDSNARPLMRRHRPASARYGKAPDPEEPPAGQAPGSSHGGKNPLPISISMTRRANHFPWVRKALVPPALPLPCVRISMPPASLPTMRAPVSEPIR